MKSTIAFAKDAPPAKLAAALRARYSQQRTLRTRATGTPFRVRWESNSIVITTGAGNERRVSPDEIALSWPMIESGATKAHLKTVTQNAAYLESVFDDVATLLTAAEEPKGASASANDYVTKARDQLAQAIRQRDGAVAAAASLTVRVAELTSAVDSARAQVTMDEATIQELRASSSSLALRVGELTSAVDSARAQVTMDEATIQELRAAAQLQGAQPQAHEFQALRTNLDTARAHAKKDLAIIDELRATIATDRVASDAAVKGLRARVVDLRSKVAADEAVETINDLRAEVIRLKKLPSAALAIELHVDGKKFITENPIHPDLLDGLREAAKLSMQFPGPSIGASRKTLEAAIRMMWIASKGEPPSNNRVSDMLYELRHDPLIPDDDWHLAKNVYSRASAFVHGKGKKPRADLALWIYFGTVQFCELVPLELA